MQILLANKFYYPRGGDCVCTINLEELLKQKGHEVAVFSMQHPENLETPWSKYFPSEVKFAPGLGIIAVSYTHLDVYKRQDLSAPGQNEPFADAGFPERIGNDRQIRSSTDTGHDTPVNSGLEAHRRSSVRENRHE